MNIQRGYAALDMQRRDIDMKHGLQQVNTAWACSMDMQLEHAAWPISIDMQYGYKDIEHGHEALACRNGFAKWTCMKGHEPAA
jgi:hypothetical protein